MIATFYFKKKNEEIDIKCSRLLVTESVQGEKVVKVARLINADPPIHNIALDALVSVHPESEEEEKDEEDERCNCPHCGESINCQYSIIAETLKKMGRKENALQNKSMDSM